jgi:hypothetical protein
MQLVERDAHTGIKGMSHSGSVKQYEVYKDVKYYQNEGFNNKD